ncbi:hypothetical protein P4H65_12085 [Paenibacillus chitinolyticus]|uniref:hypothetical protein n=1 Tax=Paenibacillus chitinolyticus TaxID=79263 RepID=UPI002DBEF028|nr:hypothetical protein [Paenibacillus chitinolyticus]MEC0246527.1 hypothetical protein [Paenibacillus chitinolyticus]
MLAQVNKILNYFKLPLIYIPMFLVIYKIYLKFKPITFMTANEVERSLYAKESRVIYSFIKYVLNILYIGVVLLYFSYLFSSLTFNTKIVSILGTPLYIAFFYYFIIQNLKKDLGRLGRFFALSYLLGWLLLLSYVLSSVFQNDSEEVNRFTHNIIIISLDFLLSAIFLFISNSVSSILKISSNKYVYFEDENKLRWYILYPVNQKEIMVGDTYIPEKCKIVKIILREKMLAIPLNLISSNELAKKNSEIQQDVTHINCYCLLTFTNTDLIKVEIQCSSNDSILLSSGVKSVKQAREIVAVHILKRLAVLPLQDTKQIKVNECCKKIRFKKERVISTSWYLYDYSPNKPTHN